MLAFLTQLGQIFYFIVLPMLLLLGLGFLLQRRLGLDMPTLTKLNFYFVVPALVYHSVVTSPLGGGAIGTVVLFAVLALAAQAGLTYLAARLAGVPRDIRGPMLMTTIFNNSGNYGLPMQDLAFRAVGRNVEAVALQVFYMIVQNFSSFTLGVLLAAGGRRDRHWKKDLAEIARFPPVYVLLAALLTVRLRAWLGEDAPRAAEALRPFWVVVEYLRGAFIAVALGTLGAQLAIVKANPRAYPVKLSVILRLLGGPALGLGVIYLLGLKGFVAQVLLLSTATPTAVNTMLLCLQFENHPDYAANAVFYSTLLSPLTVTLTVWLVQGGILPGFSA